MRHRLNNRLREIAERANANRIVLFADDAQRLFEIEYEWLQEVHDELLRHGIALVDFPGRHAVCFAGRSHFFSLKASTNWLLVLWLKNSRSEAFLAPRTVPLACNRMTSALHQLAWNKPTRSFFCRALSTQVYGWQSKEALFGTPLSMRTVAQGLPGDAEIPMEYFHSRCGVHSD